jgi:hypothetical protein
LKIRQSKANGQGKKRKLETSRAKGKGQEA